MESRRVQLHVTYGNARIAAKGHGAIETTEAFAKARSSASGEKDAPGRLAADYGLWTGCYARGELAAMRSHTTNFLADVEAKPDSPEARRGVELLRERNALVFDGLLNIALAEDENRAGDSDRALAVMDEVLSDRGATDFDAAEREFRSAVAIAKRQRARAYGLRAALSLAKLLKSVSRLTDARAVLAPALEGFSPASEMPEIREAEQLLARLP